MGWLSGWAKRIEITIDNTNIDSDLTHYPVMLKLGASVGAGSDDVSAIFDEVGSNSKKIAITKDDGESQIYAEIEKWDSGSEEAILWVSKSDLVLSASGTTTLFIYYDNTKPDNTTYVADSGSRPEVWNSDYLAVFHLIEDPTGTIKDSTSNGYNLASPNLDSADLTTGKIGAGIKKDSGEYFNQASGIPISANSDFSFQAWVYPTTWLGDNPGVWRGGSSSNGTSFNIFQAATGRPWVRWNGTDILKPGSGTAVSLSAWSLISYVIDSASFAKFYINQTEEYTANHAVSTGATTINNIGYQYAIGQEVVGTFDEIRISTVARSAAWIKADYYTQTDALVSYGSEETAGTAANDERDAKLIGTDTASDERDAKVTGGQTMSVDYVNVQFVSGTDTNSERASKTTGSLSSNSDRSAKLSGKDTVNNYRVSKLTGKDTDNDSRSAKTTGKDTSESERAAKLTGKATDNSERAANLTGEQTTNNERAAKLTGEATASDEREAKLTGSGGTASTRSAKLTGNETTDSSISTKITGEQVDNDSRLAKLYGKDTANSQRLAKTTGKDTANSGRSVKLTGKAETDSERVAKLSGYNTISDERLAKTTGEQITLNTKSAKLTGKSFTNSQKSAKIRGYQATSASRTARIIGKDISYSERAASTAGLDTVAGERSVRLTGKAATSDLRSAKLTGQSGISSERNITLTGWLRVVSERLLSIFGKDTTFGEKQVKVSGKESVSGERSLKLFGKDSVESERAGKIYGKDTALSERSAKTKGQSSTSSERFSKIHGSVVIASERSARLTGIATPAEPRRMRPNLTRYNLFRNGLRPSGVVLFGSIKRMRPVK